MAKLAKAVFVNGVLLKPGQEPEPRLAALITNPDCWEDGKAPGAQDNVTEPAEPKPEGNDNADTEPAARKTAAKKPARGRTTADEGTSGQ
ncbi:hypothetical protein [Streptomyces sp. NPDC004728]|uniref:hypothetical protein n=1 Tax=Streptomyces sp. NPDC004728 TaxID=3154289 RepID=UPI0033B02806